MSGLSGQVLTVTKKVHWFIFEYVAFYYLGE